MSNISKKELERILPFKIPEWFSLEDYEDVVSYSLHDWSNALTLRNHAAYMLNPEEVIHGSEDKRKESFWEYLEHASKKMHEATSRYSRYDGKRDYWKLSCRSVAPIPLGLIGGLWGDTTRNDLAKKYADNLLKGRSPDKGKEEYDLIEQLPYDFSHEKKGQEFIHYTGGFTYVSIDMEAPDETLIEHFKELLKDYRSILELSSLPKKITRNDLRGWASKNVLLYIDLMLLSQFHNQKISQQTMGVILFPDDYYISLDDRVRKTIKPLADKLLSDDFVATLRAQADSTPEKEEQ